MHHAFLLRTEADYHRALALIDELWDAPHGSPEHHTLDVMAELVSEYEADRRPVPEIDPLEVIRFKLRELGWTQNRLAQELGWTSGRASEVLNGKRPLNLSMSRQIAQKLGIRLGLLLRDQPDGLWIRLPDSLGARVAQSAPTVSLQVATVQLVEFGLALKGQYVANNITTSNAIDVTAEPEAATMPTIRGACA